MNLLSVIIDLYIYNLKMDSHSDQRFIIKVKTMDNNVCDFEFDPELPIYELKILISQRIKVPHNR